MAFLMDLLSGGLICPIALICLFLLTDEWKISRADQVALTLLTFINTLSVALLVPCPIIIRMMVAWIVAFIPAVCCCRVRGSRLIFLLLTATTFSYLNSATSSLLSPLLGIHPFYTRILCCALFILSGQFFFFPLFRKVFHSVRNGWLVSSLLPLSVLFVYLALWEYWVDPAVLFSADVRYLAALLSIFTPVTYFVLFRFIHVQQEQHAQSLSHSILRLRLKALLWQTERRKKNELAGRILRHDLRHYVPLLRTCLAANDESSAQKALSHMQRLVAQSRPPLQPFSSTSGKMLDSMLIDTVIDYFTASAHAYNIPLSIHLPLPKPLPIPAALLAALLTDSLDCAVQGCLLPQTTKPCAIDLYVGGAGACFEVRISSTFGGSIVLDPATGYPRMLEVQPTYPYAAIGLALRQAGVVITATPRAGWLELRASLGEESCYAN